MTQGQHDLINELEHVPYGHELQAYLITLAAAATGKKRPSPDYMRNLDRSESSLFVSRGDILEILEVMRSVSNRHGYLNPWEMENRIIEALCPEQPGALQNALSYTDGLLSSGRRPDPLTGYLQKPNVPLMIAQAKLYSDHTGTPVTLFKLDYSNMGGTNNFFEDLLHKADPAMPKADAKQWAMGLTDRAARLLSGIIRAETEAWPAEYARSGGDEADIVLAGLPPEKRQERLDRIHAALGRAIERMELHCHPHLKEKKNPLKRGFGAALAAIDLGQCGNYPDAVHHANEEIKATKLGIGKARTARIGDSTPFFRTLNDPQAARDYLARLERNMADLEEEYDIDKEVKRTPDLAEAMLEQMDAEKLPTLEDIKREIGHRLDNSISRLGLSDRARALISSKIEQYPAIDYATGALAERDMPMVAGLCTRLTLKIKERLAPEQKPESGCKIWGLGINMHNAGGLNALLGHEGTNVVMAHFHTQIIGEAIRRQGVSNRHFYVAHYGGGDFRAVIQPIILNEQTGAYRPLTEPDITAIRTTMQEALEQFNQRTVADFLYARGAMIDGLDSGLVFADVENDKPERRPHENGVTATIQETALPLDDLAAQTVRGGAFMHQIGHNTMQAIERRRLTYGTETPPSGAGNQHQSGFRPNAA